MSVLSAIMTMAAGTLPTNTQRQRRDRDAYMAPPPPPPPSQPPTITPSWRIPLSLAWAAVAFAVVSAVTIAGLLWDLRRDIRDLKHGVWTIEDQREMVRMAGQSGLMLPDTVEIIRRRLAPPQQP